ncbi:hypothetical protein SEA_RUTHERFERD_45 [Mycobacterium phage Rutherferd]|nr:hypothetical protein SEA_RUTHERFERD_45 [Mycobacterium phage Rutherferd]
MSTPILVVEGMNDPGYYPVYLNGRFIGALAAPLTPLWRVDDWDGLIRSEAVIELRVAEVPVLKPVPEKRKWSTHMGLRRPE